MHSGVYPIPIVPIKFEISGVLAPLNEVAHPTSTHFEPMPTSTPGVTHITGEQPVFYIYKNYADGGNHFAPDGWMGDLNSIHFSDCKSLTGSYTETSIEITYAPSARDSEGWAGIFWLFPENNWGINPGGYDLSGYKTLHFRAKSQKNRS